MKASLRDLRAVKDKNILTRIREVIDNVERTNKPTEISNLKKLKSTGPYYRIRIGEFRVGLRIEADTVTFVRALNRKSIYRYFP